MIHTFTVKVNTGKRTKPEVSVSYHGQKEVALSNGKVHSKDKVAVFIGAVVQQAFDREVNRV